MRRHQAVYSSVKAGVRRWEGGSKVVGRRQQGGSKAAVIMRQDSIIKVFDLTATQDVKCQLKIALINYSDYPGTCAIGKSKD